MDNWCQWQSFTEATCDRAPLYLGNYEIALVDELWRYKKGRSRLIYIGKVYKPARTIRGRLREHLRATVGGRGNQKIATFLDMGYRLKVRWRHHYDPTSGECELFYDFEKRHGELPVANAYGCSVNKMLDACATCVAA